MSVSQSAAISRAPAVPPRSSEVRTTLKRVSFSITFQTSRRAQEFLRSIVEKALASDDHLKEPSIGNSVLGCEHDYDTGGDSVVGITANDFLKRLKSMEGTDIAGDVAFNVEKLDGILNGCGVRANLPNGCFEVPMQVSITSSSVLGSEMLATHCAVKKTREF